MFSTCCNFIFVAVLLLISMIVPAFAGLLDIRPGDVFSAEKKQGGASYHLKLVIEAHQGFVLTKTKSSGGKKLEKNVTGSWHLLSGGKNLQLTNRHGYYRILTVGAENLYLEAPRAFFNYETIVLRPAQKNTKVCRNVGGHLEIRGKLFFLHDDATGLTYELQGVSLEAISDFCAPTGIECPTLAEGCGMNVNDNLPPRLRVLSIARAHHPLPRTWSATPKTFGLRVADTVWVLVFPQRQTEKQPIKICFSTDMKRFDRGILHLCQQGTDSHFPYVVNREQISLPAEERSRLPSHLAGMFTFPLTWRVDGDRLELRAPNGNVTVWEKAQMTNEDFP